MSILPTPTARHARVSSGRQSSVRGNCARLSVYSQDRLIGIFAHQAVLIEELRGGGEVGLLKR